jgi:surface polysaccharide O-acyltransferase-like enzyme
MYYTEGAAYDILRFFETFIGDGLCLVAVPLFYAISGYLFFVKVPDGIRSIFPKMRKRVRTLLIPYFLANTLTLTYISPPIAFQLWFVRNLMVIILFSPFIYLWLHYTVKAKTKYGLTSYIIIWILLFLFGAGNGYTVALMWFSLGGFMALSTIEFHWTIRKPDVVFLSVYLCLSVFHALNLFSPIITPWIPLFGIPAIWFIYDRLTCRKLIKNRIPGELCSYTFFIYLIHEPFLNIFKKLPLLISKNEYWMTACYLLIPVIFVIVVCIIGYYLKKYIPRFYTIYTGGR